MSNNVPTKIFKRNEYGLIDDPSVVYVFNEDGTINWRKMIKPEFLVPNKERFEKNGKPVPKSIEGLEDRELIILLGGIKDLAKIRGYSKVHHDVKAPAGDYVVSACSIEWIPNYETENRAVTFTAIGDASVFNTNSFGKSFLAAIAENRAFVRSVRNFLQINIVSQEELGANGSTPQQEPETDTASSALKEIMTAYGVSFDKVKATLIKDKFDNAETFSKVEDIPKFKQFELIERIKKAASKPKESAAAAS